MALSEGIEPIPRGYATVLFGILEHPGDIITWTRRLAQALRAAERNPSTPNRVWVTPAVGGPHTKFMLHFRVLLNDADYHYRLTGTRCPAITLNGGGGDDDDGDGDGGGALGLRGRIWADVVNAVDGQTWCPGTYHLSATVMDLGSHGSLTHPARPFGTATFTVRP